jgi:hypothetical protein
MKKILFTILLFTISFEFVISQAFECRLITNNYGYLEYQMRETTGTNPPWGDPAVWSEFDRPITDITFTIRWAQSLGDPLEINLLCTNYNIIEGTVNAQTHPTESYYYKKFGCDPIPVYPPADTNFWQQNVWQTIATMKITNGSSGTGDFSIAPSGWILEALNFSYDSDENTIPEAYTPTINANVTAYPFPTLVFDRVWSGGSSAAWNQALNWTGTCGNVGAGIPSSTMNVLVPNIDETVANNPSTSGAAMSAKSLTIGPGGWLIVPTGRTLTVPQTTVVQSDGLLEFAAGTATGVLNSIELKPSAVRAAGQLNIYPGGKVTASGTTTLTSASQLRVLASATAVGSFIDNGTIVQTTGSADVQTFIKNAAAPGSYYAHLVGPTVSDPAFQTAYSYPGVYLSAFDLVGLGTYAYEYTEPINNWTNIFLNTAPVRSTKGIMLSTVDAINHTMTMTGKLVTGTLSSAALQHGGTNNLDLLSNPYPSSLDFLVFYTTNSANITNKYYLYDPATGTYLFYITTGGGTLTKNIQVGQGFFVETLNTTPVTFTNSMRLHSTAAFYKDDYAYQLRLNLSGNGFSDATFIYFKPEGNWGYDLLQDAYKWWSILPEASEIWTVANDQSLLCMNSLPELGNGMVSVPMSFKCGAAGNYTISAENIGSFDIGTDIFLEDLAIGGEWYNLVQNPVYEFTGTPDGDQNRFIVHFFGPTGIHDHDANSFVKIYGYGQDAYIVNRGTETIKEYIAYDMMGRELHSGTLPNSTVNKVTIGNVSAYYIVKVITKEGHVYTDKVYITK